MLRGQAGSRKLEDLAATRNLGAELARVLGSGDVLLMVGELGAGKTSLTQGLAAELGVKQAVTSPTFALCNQLAGRVVIHHYDLYRLKSTRELVEIGFEESLEEDVLVVVEWPKPALELLFGEVLVMRMYHDGDGRKAAWKWVRAEDLSAEDLGAGLS